jgi:hypothetical protein
VCAGVAHRGAEVAVVTAAVVSWLRNGLRPSQEMSSGGCVDSKVQSLQSQQRATRDSDCPSVEDAASTKRGCAEPRASCKCPSKPHAATCVCLHSKLPESSSTIGRPIYINVTTAPVHDSCDSQINHPRSCARLPSEVEEDSVRHRKYG